eukprot:9307124-Alexandrium_andersonii.AAC.1
MDPLDQVSPHAHGLILRGPVRRVLVEGLLGLAEEGAADLVGVVVGPAPLVHALYELVLLCVVDCLAEP